MIDRRTGRRRAYGLPPQTARIKRFRNGAVLEPTMRKPATGTTLVDGRRQPTGGDLVVAFDGEKLTSAVALQSAVDAHRPGDKVTLTLLRSGSRRTIEVTLGVRP